jgi:hypothetical protein
MGFASYQEDILLRAAENGFDTGAAKPVSGPVPGDGFTESNDVPSTTRRRLKTIHLHGEEARRFVLKHMCGAKEIAYLQVIETKTGNLVQEFPYRQRAEVEARLAQIEIKYPGTLRLRIVKRLEIPEDRVQSESIAAPVRQGTWAAPDV